MPSRPSSRRADPQGSRPTDSGGGGGGAAPADVDTWFYPCWYEMQVGLAEMYVQDLRFRAHYDDVQPGLADYVPARAIATANTLDHIA